MILGYHLSSEEHGPNDLVENARRAEEAGFFRLYEREILPQVGRIAVGARA